MAETSGQAASTAHDRDKVLSRSAPAKTDRRSAGAQCPGSLLAAERIAAALWAVAVSASLLATAAMLLAEFLR